MASVNAKMASATRPPSSPARADTTLLKAPKKGEFRKASVLA